MIAELSLVKLFITSVILRDQCRAVECRTVFIAAVGGSRMGIRTQKSGVIELRDSGLNFGAVYVRLLRSSFCSLRDRPFIVQRERERASEFKHVDLEWTPNSRIEARDIFLPMKHSPVDVGNGRNLRKSTPLFDTFRNSIQGIHRSHSMILEPIR